MSNQQNHTQDQETKPLVTFIITYFEQPTVMLIKCIESVLTLSLRPYEREIIVIDDGSQNSPLADLKRFENDIVYLRKSNGGVSTARNYGLRSASGSYIQFIDGDDMLLTNNYEHCLDIIRYGQADVVAFDFSHSIESTVTYEDSSPLSGSELMTSRNIYGSACTYLFKKSILGNLSFTPGITYGEDEEFTPQLLLRADSVVTTTAQAYFYRRHSSSAIGNKSPEALQRRLDDNYHIILSLHHIADTLPTSERIAMQRRIAQLTMDYIYNIITLTRNRQQLDTRIEVLRNDGLFPLPDQNYTQKYKWFRRMTNSSIGRSLLMKTLPLMAQER